VKLKELHRHVFQVTIPLPLDVQEVNVYLFTGKVPTLIDTGTKTPEALQGIREALRQTGVERLEQVLLTHWHVDHAGGAAALAQDGAQVMISARDYTEWVDFVQGGAQRELHERIFREWAVPAEEVQAMQRIYSWLRPLTDFPGQVRQITPRECIAAGDYCLRPVLTPGHTAGHLAFFAEELQFLFSGDLLLPDQVPYPGVWAEGEEVVSGLPSYLESLTKVEELRAKAYFPAHGQADSDPATRCREVREIIYNQVERYQAADSIYQAASRHVNGKGKLGALFYHLHYVYGWHRVKEMLT